MRNIKIKATLIATYLLVPIQLLPQAFNFCLLIQFIFLGARINLIVSVIGLAAADKVTL